LPLYTACRELRTVSKTGAEFQLQNFIPHHDKHIPNILIEHMVVVCVWCINFAISRVEAFYTATWNLKFTAKLSGQMSTMQSVAFEFFKKITMLGVILKQKIWVVEIIVLIFVRRLCGY
jgi:hypothetical protein